ncbi:MAG: helix-turn-helix domain-containing protein [Sellimonas intestinalis]
MGIGSKLTKLMKEQDTNANELASKAGVPPTTIYSLIRRDSNRVDIDSLIKNCKGAWSYGRIFLQ